MTNIINPLLTRDNVQRYCASCGADCCVHFHICSDTDIDYLPEPIHQIGALVSLELQIQPPLVHVSFPKGFTSKKTVIYSLRELNIFLHVQVVDLHM